MPSPFEVLAEHPIAYQGLIPYDKPEKIREMPLSEKVGCYHGIKVKDTLNRGAKARCRTIEEVYESLYAKTALDPQGFGAKIYKDPQKLVDAFEKKLFKLAQARIKVVAKE